MILTIVFGVIGFGIMVFVHELGHFLAAKRVGIHVETFSLGWGLKGIWWGLALGLSIVAVCLMIWIRLRGPAHVHSAGEPFPTAAESFDAEAS